MDFLSKIKNKLKIQTLKIEDLFYLNELLNSNLPIKSCLMLIKNKTNSKIIDDLICKLDKGFLIEEIIDDYLPKDISLYMKNLIKRLSFSESLKLSISFYNKNKENNKILFKSIAYPIFLLFISLTALFIFDNYGLDTILNLMNTFNVDTIAFQYFRVVLKILIYVFYFAFIAISIIVLIFINPKRITLFYIILCKYFSNSIIQIYFTEEFVSLFIIALDLGYHTKDALEILKSLKNKPLISFLAFHIDDQLMAGESLKDASNQEYYDHVLTSFINIASYSNNFTSILNNYALLAKEKIQNKMKLYTSILQLSSYVVIGIVIIFIYQVLFLPMQAINAF